jgi:hypothetical protein
MLVFQINSDVVRGAFFLYNFKKGILFDIRNDYKLTSLSSGLIINDKRLHTAHKILGGEAVVPLNKMKIKKAQILSKIGKAISGRHGNC